jgi:hypothetical protein
MSLSKALSEASGHFDIVTSDTRIGPLLKVLFVSSLFSSLHSWLTSSLLFSIPCLLSLLCSPLSFSPYLSFPLLSSFLVSSALIIFTSPLPTPPHHSSSSRSSSLSQQSNTLLNNTHRIIHICIHIFNYVDLLLCSF